MSKFQMVERKDDGDFKELRVSDSDHLPSWKAPGTIGSAEIRLTTHAKGEWLGVSTIEWNLGEKNRTTQRQTMLTLNKKAAIALRDMLNEAFP